MGDESVTSIDYYDEFNVNLLLNRSIYRPMCTHMGELNYFTGFYWTVYVKPKWKLLLCIINASTLYILMKDKYLYSPEDTSVYDYTSFDK